MFEVKLVTNPVEELDEYIWTVRVLGQPDWGGGSGLWVLGMEREKERVREKYLGD